MATMGKGIAETIQKRMTEQGVSVNALHIQTGLSYNTLKGRLNTGHELKVEELRLIAEALGTTPYEIWADAAQMTVAA